MKNKTRMMISISILLIASISCQMLTDLLPGGGANPGSFTAEATSPVSVQLTWSSVEGAQKYLIERNDGQTDYFPLGEIPGETTTFEDFLVPSNTQVTYRIETVTASGTSGGKTVSLTTPQEFPNPLTVAATFDTQNAQSQAIGADGGNVSITDSRGVRYTLDIPAGALDNEVTFTLTPIQDIQGLPLSGGMTSGVRIEPEGLVFNQSATLSIETAEADETDEMIDMAFAFDGEGREFHFVPSSSAAGTSAVFKLARPASVGPLPGIINVPQNKSYGSGKGTSKDIRNQVKNHAPSKPADKLNQKMAAGNKSAAIPVMTAVLLYSGREVELQVAGAFDWPEFTIALDSFQAWLDQLEANKDLVKKDQLDKREEAIWEELVNDAVALIDKASKDCKKSPKISTNLADAKKLVNQLLSGKSPFYRKFAEKMHKYSYQETALRNIKAFLDRCSPGWKIALFPSTFTNPLLGIGKCTGLLSCGSPYGPWDINCEWNSEIDNLLVKTTLRRIIPFSEDGKTTATLEEHQLATDKDSQSGNDRLGTQENVTITPNSEGYQINIPATRMVGKVWAIDSHGYYEIPIDETQDADVWSIVPADPGECGQP